MALRHQRDICKRCIQGPKWIKARGLCESCWMTVNADGHLEDWPRLDAMKRRHLHDGMCHCYSPIPERLGLFNVSQCMKCGRKLPDG